MKKNLLIFIWCIGILIGCVWVFLCVAGMIYLHRFSIPALILFGGYAYLAYMSFRFLREELGGPRVEFKQENPLTEEQRDQLRSLWK